MHMRAPVSLGSITIFMHTCKDRIIMNSSIICKCSRQAVPFLSNMHTVSMDKLTSESLNPRNSMHNPPTTLRFSVATRGRRSPSCLVVFVHTTCTQALSLCSQRAWYISHFKPASHLSLQRLLVSSGQVLCGRMGRINHAHELHDIYFLTDVAYHRKM